MQMLARAYRCLISISGFDSGPSAPRAGFLWALCVLAKAARIAWWSSAGLALVLALRATSTPLPPHSEVGMT